MMYYFLHLFWSIKHHFHKTTITIGKPISPAELELGEDSGLEAYRKAAKMIMQEIKKLRENEENNK